jgi:hypothetical protein
MGKRKEKKGKKKGKRLDSYEGRLCDGEDQVGGNGAGGTQKWSEHPRLCCYRR